MNIATGIPDFDAPVARHARKDFPLLDADMTVGEALERVRRESEDRHRSVATVGPEFFEALGFRIEQIRGVSPWRIFRFRFPWLLVTVTGGTLSAILAGFFEATLARGLVLAFFLTMVLGLNESVSTQSMSVRIHAWRSVPVTWHWLATAFRREVITAFLLGVACGSVGGAIVWIWRNDLRGAFVIGG